MWVKLGCN